MKDANADRTKDSSARKGWCPLSRTKVKEPPTLVGFFNQLKQEYASARWLLYEGSQTDTVHFSDREVVLYNTLDYSCHALAVEKTKIAFRMAYSMFDKLVLFLNEYLHLGIKDYDVGGNVHLKQMAIAFSKVVHTLGRDAAKPACKNLHG